MMSRVAIDPMPPLNAVPGYILFNTIRSKTTENVESAVTPSLIGPFTAI